jgi:hypothetical protein
MAMTTLAESLDLEQLLKVAKSQVEITSQMRARNRMLPTYSFGPVPLPKRTSFGPSSSKSLPILHLLLQAALFSSIVGVLFCKIGGIMMWLPFLIFSWQLLGFVSDIGTS